MFAQKSAHSVSYPERSPGSSHQPETWTSPERSSLTYNPRETRDEFLARQRRAYDAGRRAWQERRIPAYLIPFYETLVERVGANSYTWVSEETLAQAFQVDVSTIKRWIARLVRVGLIRRQRQFATSSRTYITTYDATTELLAGEAAAATATGIQATPPTTAGCDDQPDSPVSTPEDQSAAPPGVSFRRIDKPSFGANVRRDSKIDHLNPGGGRKHTLADHSVAPDVLRLLKQEGVLDFYIAPLLGQYSLPELTAISRYLDTQRNIRDRARLFAALACRNFGAQLLAGREQRGIEASPRTSGNRSAAPHPDAHLRYISGNLAPYIKGWDAQQPEISVPAREPTSSHQGAPCGALWQQVLDHVQHALPEGEFKTWFEEASLLTADDTAVVVGVPNIFARDKLQAEYAPLLSDAFRARCGTQVQVQVVIGS